MGWGVKDLQAFLDVDTGCHGSTSVLGNISIICFDSRQGLSVADGEAIVFTDWQPLVSDRRVRLV